MEVTLTQEPQVVHCPSCQQAVVLPAADGSIPQVRTAGQYAIEDDLPAPPPPEEEELDPRHIRRISTARRAAYRSRSWYLIGMMLSLMGAGQLFILGGTHFYNKGFATLPAAFVMVGMILVALAYRAYLKAGDAIRDVQNTSIPEPTHPPDFTSLSDGSQYSHNLEKMFHDDHDKK